ncbi:hypothetical protein SAMN04489724_0686 [Algoriphagus locisalis]|uniref:Uncharacterized protein n=1 Tax=Algoriphagus locisalis TaxID=305507 RepID=A0A1I6XUU9_9BACT|nr:DUF6520 family protein [Algoriphagus locisalis]SFT42229.1 hypothetical protein SAMN04489724_0686 [Algoriphagus locisalis]
MNKLKGALPIIAFVFAAFAAFAFNFPQKGTDPRYGTHDGKVYDVTNVNMGDGIDEYQCDELEDQCLFENQALTIPVENSDGEFIPGPALPHIP